MTSNLTKLVPFLLGLFVSACIGRWWTMRSQYLQPIISASVQLSFWLRAALPAEASWVRERVERDCLLGHKLVYLCGQGKQDHHILELLKEEGLLTKTEYDRLEEKAQVMPKEAHTLDDGLFDFDLATLPFTWSAHLIYRVFQFGVRTKGENGINIPVPICVKMLSYCMEAKQCIEKVEMMLSSPLPFPYVHLVCLLVHFTAVLSCVEAGLSLGTAPELTLTQASCTAFTVLATNALYTGLLCLAVVLTDPFGEDVVDFPATLFHHRLWKAQRFTGLMEEDDESIDQELSSRFLQQGSKALLRSGPVGGRTSAYEASPSRHGLDFSPPRQALDYHDFLEADNGQADQAVADADEEDDDAACGEQGQ